MKKLLLSKSKRKNAIRILTVLLVCVTFFSQIQAQEKVKIILDGKEVFVFDSSRIDVKNTNGNTFIGSDAGSSNTPDPTGGLEGKENTFIGNKAGRKNTTGRNNIFVGSYSGDEMKTGRSNSAFGHSALTVDTSGINNSAFGAAALLSLTSGNFNLGLGVYSGQNLKTGDNNIMIGHRSGGGSAVVNYSNNVCIGSYAGYNRNADNKLYISHSISEVANPLIYGDFANDTVKIYGTLGIKDEYTFPSTDGMTGQVLANNGSGALTWTSLSTANSLNDLDDVITDYTTSYNMIAGKGGGMLQATGILNTGFGELTLRDLSTGKRSNAFGSSALYQTTSGENNNAFGTHALAENISGNNNVAFGDKAGFASVTGNDNVSLGNNANQNNETGNRNTSIGNYAGRGISGDSKSGGVMIGYKAGFTETEDDKLYIENSESTTPLIYGDFANDTVKIYGTLGIKDEYTFPSTDGTMGQVLANNGSGVLAWSSISGVDSLNDLSDCMVDYGSSHNFFGGRLAGEHVSTGKYNLGWGQESLFSVETGSRNVGIGHNTLGNIVGGNNNIAIGNQALRWAINKSDNVAIGDSSLYNNGNAGTAFQGVRNVAIGSKTLISNTTGSENTGIGYKALNNNMTGDWNVALGAFSLFDNTGEANVAIGSYTLISNTTGQSNTAIGDRTMRDNKDGSYNVAIGNEAHLRSKHGDENVVMGHTAFFNDTIGDKNLILGSEAMYSSKATSNNVALGYQAGYLTTGGGNVFVGNRAGYNETSSHTLYIANDSTSTPLIYGSFLDDSLQINGKMRINCTTSAYDFVNTEYSGEPCLVPTAQNYGYLGTSDHFLYKVYSNFFYAGDVANYQTYSDRRIKDNIQPLKGAMERFMSINPVSYDLKKEFYLKGRKLSAKEEASRKNRFGFIAQEMEEIYPSFVKTDEKTGLKSVGYQALIPEMVSVIQEQQQVIETTKLEIKEMKEENKALIDRLSKLENLMNKMVDEKRN